MFADLLTAAGGTDLLTGGIDLFVEVVVLTVPRTERPDPDDDLERESKTEYKSLFE